MAYVPHVQDKKYLESLSTVLSREADHYDLAESLIESAQKYLENDNPSGVFSHCITPNIQRYAGFVEAVDAIYRMPVGDREMAISDNFRDIIIQTATKILHHDGINSGILSFMDAQAVFHCLRLLGGDVPIELVYQLSGIVNRCLRENENQEGTPWVQQTRDLMDERFSDVLV